MNRIVTAFVLLTWAVLPLSGQTGKDASAKAAPPAAASKAQPSASAEASNVQDLVKEFDDKRQSLLVAHRAALVRLREARTEEARREILAELRQLQQERLAEQRENARQMRERMQQTQRPNRPGG